MHKKEIIAASVFILLILAGLILWFFDSKTHTTNGNLFDKASDTKRLEKTLIDRYGSLEEAERINEEQNDPCGTTPHWSTNC